MCAKNKKTSVDEFEPIKQLIIDNKISKKEITDLSKIDYPLFSFKYLQTNSIKKCESASFFFNFLLRLNKLSTEGWNKIRLSPKHKYGMEPLPKDKIKPSLVPLKDIVTPEVKKLHVFRANNELYPFVGLQIGKIFHVFFIESKFGDIYDHG